MKRHNHFGFLATAFLSLALWACSGGSNPPADGGDGGDGGQAECSVAAQCDDGNPCTDDLCVGGKCVHNNNDAPCDDGQECSTGDHCVNGVCVGETTLDCEDGNPCTEDTCSDEEGCVHYPNHAPCDDGNACTTGDVCSNGECTGGEPVYCDDGNPCTDDDCDPARGCVYTNNDAPCDDGQACSTNDRCVDGVCKGDSEVDCDDGNPCTTDRCDDALGCLHINNAAPCDDGNACTTGDRCQGGLCMGGEQVDCDDGNPCTTDTCDEQAGCRHENNNDPCDDGNACTAGDTCSDGTCVPGSARSCDDSNPCTDDSCDPSLGCIHNNNTAPCDDGNPCTDGDHCEGGRCVGGTSQFDCDDGNPCTDDLCNPQTGCSYQFNNDPCDDDDACTMSDTCNQGVCQGVPLDADGDGVVASSCTSGAGDCCDSGNESSPGCSPATAAQINPNAFEGTSAAGTCSDGIDNDCDGLVDSADQGCQGCSTDSDCDDGNVCNGVERCVGNQCQAGTPLDCDDGNVCTTDTCDPSQGCQRSNNTLACDDGNPCTVGDRCSGGICQPGSGTLDCDDGNDCTTDTCSPTSGCQHTNVANNTPCDDGDPCNTGDYCLDGQCQPGSGPADCDDGNPCTTDECVAGVGCTHTDVAENTPCDDENPCTENDKCTTGQCRGTTVVCNDNNPCTADSCDPSIGCVATPDDSATCSHPDPCIVNDRCQDGVCVGDPEDQDGDGHGNEACGGDDCDDQHADTYPGAPELCGDGRDNNCNYLADENCTGCSQVDPAAELVIDSDSPAAAYRIDANDEAISLFVAEPLSYTMIQATAAFYDLNCGNGGDSGSYSLHVYQDQDGQPGQELASSPVQTVNITLQTAGDCSTQEITWATFTLTSPVTFSQGQAFWVALRSQDQEMDDQGNGDAFVPLFSAPVLMPYLGSVLKDATDGQYYLAQGNWMLRVQGCAEGPWLEIASHTNPAALQPGQESSVTVELRNRGFADAAGVAGTMSCDDASIAITQGSSNFGDIAQNASSTGSPAFHVQPDATAYGLYTLSVNSVSGTGTWTDGFQVYVPGSGCSTDNHTISADSGTPAYIVPLSAGDFAGNYFVVDSTSFTLTSVEAAVYKVGNPPSPRLRARVYSYRNGAPDQLLSESSWVTVSSFYPDPQMFTLQTPLTLRQGDVVFVVVESQNDMTCQQDSQGNLTDCVSLLTDDGQNPSLLSGLMWASADQKYYGLALSMVVKLHGCQATEIVYDSHTQNPAQPSPGDTVSLAITLKNEGAIDATNVTATLSYSDPDVTVTQASGNYGTIGAGQTKSVSGFQVQIASGADQYQYNLDLDITDGINTWHDQVPLRLAGGYVDLTFSEFTTSLAGNDIHYHFVVTNQGNVDCITPFRVDLYVDTETEPGPNQDGDWNQMVDGLAAGASQAFDLALSDAPAGTYTAWVQCDTTQQVAESDENNNVSGPSEQTVGTTDVFELLDPARRWFSQDMPVGYRFVAGNSQPGLTQSEARTGVSLGFQHWEDVPTASITFRQLSDAPSGSGGYNYYDGYNTMTFNDPDGDLGTGALAATVPVYTQSQSTVVNGVTFYRMTDADIVFNDNVAFGTNAEAASGSCWSSQLFDIEGVATHEIGHLLGLDHAPVQDATMYYAIGPCDPTRVTLEQSDINGVTFIYP